MPFIDLIIPFVYLGVVAAIGWWSSRRAKSLSALFLAGRGLGFGVIGLSLFASNISSTTLVGLAGAAYSSGIAVVNYEWMAAIVLGLAAVIMVPIYLRAKVSTVPHYLEMRYSRVVRHYCSGLMIILSIIVDTAGSLFAGAVVLQVFIPALPLLPTIAALGIFAGLYTIFGGLRAVMLTDALQAILLLVGSSVIAIAVFGVFDYSFTAVSEALGPDRLSLVRPIDDPEMPWTGLLIGVPILGFYYWATNQYISQRLLAARNEDQARWGAVLAGFLKLAPLFIMVLPGAMAVVIFPDLERADQVFAKLVSEFLPIGLRGLVLAALLAAIMSTIDSTLNAASALVTFDFLGLEEDQGHERRNLLIARSITAGFMIIAIIWAPLIDDFPGLFSYLQQMFSYAVPPVAVIFLGGMLWRKATKQGALGALLAGHGFGVLIFIIDRAGHWPLHFLETAGLTTAISAATLYGISRHTTPRALSANLIWTPDMARMTRVYPMILDYRTQLTLVVTLAAILLFLFW